MHKRDTLTWPNVRIVEQSRAYRVERMLRGEWVLISMFPFFKSGILQEESKDEAYNKALGTAIHFR